MRNWALFLVSGLVFWLVFSCQKKEEMFRTDSGEARVLISEPVMISSISCPLCQRAVLACGIKEDAGVEFNQVLELVFSEYGFEVIKARIGDDKVVPELRVIDWLKLARGLQTNYLVIPVVYCYSERKGSGASASEPAEVGFHFHIFEVSSGKEVWGGDFRERQKALSENLLELNKFIKRKAKWLKAEELAREGVKEMVREFLKASKKE